MNWLEQIQWQHDLGVELRMMNNQLPLGRNTWYQQVLQSTVKDRRCVEIGFGAGLLSIMAVAAGAQHITAWEQDHNRYRLGQHIIQQLDLKDRITLKQGKYTAQQTPDPDVVVFHEIIGPNIWQEGMRDSLPLGTNLIVPGEYIMKFEILAVPDKQYYQSFFSTRTFDPGIDIDNKYITLVQDLIDRSPNLERQREWYKKYPVVDLADFYHINVNTIANLPGTYTAGIELPKLPNHRFILYPVSYIQHKSQRLFWSYYNPMLVPRGLSSVSVTQDFNTGEFLLLDTR